MEEVDVRAKLTLKDESHGPLEHIKHGFEGVKETAEETAHEVLSFGRDVAAAFIGFEIGSAVESIKSFGEEIIHAASATEEQAKGLAGILVLNDEASDSFEATSAAAMGLKDDLEELAIGAGANADAVIDGFSRMAERGGHSIAELKHLSEDAVYAGRAVKGGFTSITDGLSMMELGSVRATNPVVNLIKQTGLMDGSAKQIAKTLTKMAADGHLEKVMSLGEQAIAKMGERMKGTKPTLENALASLSTIRENLFETAGTPILTALTPELEKLAHWLQENGAQIRGYAELLGEEVGEWVTEASEEFQEGFQYIRTHSQEIKDGLREAMGEVKTAFGYAKQVAEFILAHREAFALAFGAKTAFGAIGGVGGVTSAVKTGAAVVGGVQSAVQAGQVLAGTRGVADITPTALKIVSLGTAISGWVAGVGGASAAATVALGYLGAALPPVAAAATAAYSGFLLWEDHEKVAAQDLKAIHQWSERVTEGFGETAEATERTANEMSRMIDAGNMAQVEILLMAEAAKTAQLALRDFAEHHEAEQGNRNSEYGEQLSQILDQNIRDKSDVVKGSKKDVLVNMPGAKVEVHQDFRDADPDRVAIMLKDGIGKSALNKVQSGFGIPFG